MTEKRGEARRRLVEDHTPYDDWGEFVRNRQKYMEEEEQEAS